MAGVNRIGTDPKCEYCGHSMIISPYGKVETECEENAECSTLAEIDVERLQSFRKKFPVLNDADSFDFL